jgi:TolA-binding protein
MGLGDATKAALSKAIEALQAIAEVKAIVQQVQIASTAFERRMEARFETLESRIRELERENAKLNGQVQAVYADTLKAVFLDRHRERVGQSDGIQGPRVGTLPDAANLGIK